MWIDEKYILTERHCDCGKLFKVYALSKKLAELEVLKLIAFHHKTKDHNIKIRKIKINKLIDENKNGFCK